MYDAYKQARNAAWQALIDGNIVSLPTPLKSIVRLANARIVDNAKINLLRDNQLGCLAMLKGSLYIVLDRTVSVQRQRYTLAHELGHILLRHTLSKATLNRDSVIVYADPQEYQAERFAIDILAPACVLWGLDLHTPEEIAKACNISMQSATIRASRMEELYKRGKFLVSPLERQMYAQFKSFIEENTKRES